MFLWKNQAGIPSPPLATYLIILVNAAVFLYQISLSPPAARTFYLHYALVPRRYFDPAWALAHGLDPHDYLPFLSGTFMHGNWLHIVINMAALLLLGTRLEGRIGRCSFLSFYLVCGLLASLAQVLFNRDSAVPALGASGAIAGVLGAYAATFPRTKVTVLIAIWFAFQFVHGFNSIASGETGSGIARWAHIGGFIAGFVLIQLWRFAPVRPSAGGSEPLPAGPPDPAAMKPFPRREEPSGGTRGQDRG